LPLRHLPAHPRRDPQGRGDPQRRHRAEDRMKNPARRKFMVDSAAIAGGSFALGFNVPGFAQEKSTEVNAWVVIRPDNTAVIRVARSEMGQGTITGLVQLVAEE